MKLKQLHSCPMNWESMASLDEQTKFCQTCTKKIHNFSDASDEEISDIMKDQTSVCARVPVSKLQESITPFQKVLLAMVICFSGTLFRVDFVYGQQGVSKQEVVVNNESSWEIKGVVRDSVTSETMIGVKITVVELEQYVLTDLEGRFSIQIPEEMDSVEIKIDFLMYTSQYRIVHKKEMVILDDIRLVDDSELMMVGIIINIDPDSGYEKNSLEDLFQREKYLPGF